VPDFLAFFASYRKISSPRYMSLRRAKLVNPRSIFGKSIFSHEAA
jgi:hypothetical protein